MKNIELLQSIVEEDDKEIREQLMKQFVKENTPVLNRFSLYDYVSKDKILRENLTGVYYDPEGFICATDAHILIAVKENFSPKMEGKIIGKQGKEIVGKYPNIWDVISYYKCDRDSCPFPFDRVKELSKELKTKKKLKEVEKDERYFLEIGAFAYGVDYLDKLSRFLVKENITTISVPVNTSATSSSLMIAKSENGSVAALMAQGTPSEIKEGCLFK